MSEARPRLPAVVKSLGVVSFFNDLASEMVYPLLPALMTGTLGGGALALGLLDGIADALSAGAKLWAGWVADRPGWRRPLVIAGYLVAAITRPLIGLAGAAWHVIGLRAADRLGKGIRSAPRDTVIAAAARPEIRGRAFGFHRGMDHAGAVAGPLVAWFLLSGAVGLDPREVILASILPGAIVVGAVVWALRKEGNRHSPERSEGEEGSGKRETGGARSVDPSIRPSPLLLVIIAFAFARLPETLLLLRLTDSGLAVAAVPVLWAGLHVVRMGASYPGGRLVDHWGPGKTMLVGWCIYAIVALGLATAETVGAAIGWFLLFGLVAAFTESPERTFVAAHAPRHAMGRRYGVYHGSAGLSALAGGIVFGALYQGAGGAVPLLASAGLTLVLALAGWRALRW